MAASIIIENAGGIVTDQNGDKIFPVDPVQYTGQGYPIIAANKKAIMVVAILFLIHSIVSPYIFWNTLYPALSPAFLLF